MGIRTWKHRGQARLVLSKVWPDGTRFRRFMQNKTTAKELETRIDYAVTTGTWRDFREQLLKGRADCNDEPTIEKFSEEYLALCRVQNRRPDFKEQALTSINRLVGDVALRDFKRRHADRFADQRLAEGVATATVNRGLAVMKHMLNVAVSREYVDTNPLLRYRMLPEVEKALRILTYEEYRTLIDAVAEEDPVIGAYTAILGETGLRKSEGLRLRWEHIRTQEKLLIVDGQAKSGKVRTIPLSSLAQEWLSRLVRFVDNPYVFVGPTTNKKWRDPRGPFKRGQANAGLDWLSGFHDLRHFRATQWLINGVDVRTVKELLGHADIQTTMRYLHYVQSHATQTVLRAQEKEQTLWERGESGGYKVETPVAAEEGRKHAARL